MAFEGLRDGTVSMFKKISKIMISIMQWVVFLIPILFLIALLGSIFSNTKGCIEANEFGFNSILVDAKDSEWTDTGLLSNGQQIIIRVSGSWSPWYSSKDTSEINRADIGYKKNGVSNLICKDGEAPKLAKNSLNGESNPNSIDCSDESYQKDPNSCSCTELFGNILDPQDKLLYNINLNELNALESALIPSDQVITKYSGGLGLKIALFGSDGLETPQRAYDLYCSLKYNECNSNLDFDDQEYCESDYASDPPSNIEESQSDIYCIYESPNKKIFKRNDVEYHEAREKIKLIIEDSYHNDNQGYYNVEFLSGILIDGEKGLLEDLVSVIERYLIGDPTVKDTAIYDDDGNYNGSDYYGGGKGVLEHFYNILVDDSVFRNIVQISMVLYITFFGIGILMGSIKLEKKEFMDRIITIAFIMFFIDSDSWYWYDKIIVSFFKDGLDSLTYIIMNSIAQINIFSNDSLGIIAQNSINPEVGFSNASRFTYIDALIKSLFDGKTHEKIWSLIFIEPLAIIIIPAIYFLIGYFCYVMVLVAAFYVTALLKLIFGLAIGPIFILFLLFKETKDNFKKWVSFLAGRSLEILIIFLVTYVCVLMIHSNFKELFWFKTCAQEFKLFWFISYSVQVPETNKTSIEWITTIIETFIILFLLQMLLDKLGILIANIIVVNGIDTPGTSATFGAGGLYGTLSNLALKARKEATSVARSAVYMAGDISLRKSGIKKNIANSELFHSFSDDDKIINKAISDVGSGKNGKALEQAVRNHLNKPGGALSDQLKGGSSYEQVKDRLHHRFVTQPLKAQSKKIALKLKKKGLFGQELRNEMRKELSAYAEKTFAGGANSASRDIEKIVNSRNKIHKNTKKGLFDKQSYWRDSDSKVSKIDHLPYSKAAELFANDFKKQNQYINHLIREGRVGDIDRFIRKVDWKKQEWDQGKNYKDLGNIDKRKKKMGMNLQKTSILQRQEFLSAGSRSSKSDKAERYAKERKEALSGAQNDAVRLKAIMHNINKEFEKQNKRNDELINKGSSAARSRSVILKEQKEKLEQVKRNYRSYLSVVKKQNRSEFQERSEIKLMNEYAKALSRGDNNISRFINQMGQKEIASISQSRISDQDLSAMQAKVNESIINAGSKEERTSILDIPSTKAEQARMQEHYNNNALSIDDAQIIKRKIEYQENKIREKEREVAIAEQEAIDSENKLRIAQGELEKIQQEESDAIGGDSLKIQEAKNNLESAKKKFDTNNNAARDAKNSAIDLKIRSLRSQVGLKQYQKTKEGITPAESSKLDSEISALESDIRSAQLSRPV